MVGETLSRFLVTALRHMDFTREMAKWTPFKKYIISVVIGLVLEPVLHWAIVRPSGGGEQG
jgi:hypothetical protein